MNISTLDKQVIAAKCLDNYCLHYKIEDTSIDELMEHLLAIKQFENLSRWERIGASLELSGRGDPLPHSLHSKIPVSQIADFKDLVNYVVEVGLVDIYGADTNEPSLFLDKCFEILSKNNIPFTSFFITKIKF